MNMMKTIVILLMAGSIYTMSGMERWGHEVHEYNEDEAFALALQAEENNDYNGEPKYPGRYHEESTVASAPRGKTKLQQELDFLAKLADREMKLADKVPSLLCLACEQKFRLPWYKRYRSWCFGLGGFALGSFVTCGLMRWCQSSH